MAAQQQIPQMTDPSAVLAQLKDPAQVEALLLQLTAPDTQLIAQAEAVIKKYLKGPVCVVGLMQQLQGSRFPQVRQMAAMLLRRRLGPLWSKVEPNTKEELKQALLQVVVNEQERAIRKNIASIIAVAAKRLLAKNKWNDLLVFIFQFSQSQIEEQRELAFVILNELAETLGKSFQSQFPSLKQIYQAALQDSSTKVQVQALKACAGLLLHLTSEEGSAVFQDLIPGMLAVAKHCLDAGDEDTVSSVLDVFSDLASTVTSVITPSLPQLVHFCLDVLKRDTLQNSTRDVAGMVITELAESKPKNLGKKGLVPDIVATLLHVMAVCQDNAAGELLSTFHEKLEEDEDDDFDGPSGQDIAQRCLDVMAINIPAKFFYEPTKALIAQGLASPDFNMRKAGTAALAVIIEGCEAEVRKDLKEILPRVFEAARDPAVAVRECACFVLGQMAENCQPEILEYHQQIVPVMFGLLEDGTLSVQLTGCHVLETFAEHLDKDLVTPYLEPLLQRLHHLLSAPKMAVQEAAIGAIAATATGAEENFAPYLHQVAPLMAQLLPITDERMLRLRGRAMDCMARMALAVGHDHFAPYVDVSLQSAMQCLQIEQLSLKEDAFLFLAQMANVMKEGFAPHLPTLVPQICEVMAESDGEVVWLNEDDEDDKTGVARIVDGVDDDEDDDTAAGSTKDESVATGDEEDEDDDDLDGTPVYDVHTGMLDVKKAATFCMGELAQHTGPHYAQYLEVSLERLSELTKSFNALLRQEVASVLPHMLSCALQAAPPVREWTKGDFTDTLPAPSRAVSKAVLDQLLGLVMDDDDQDAASSALASLQAILERTGPSLLIGPEDRERFMISILQVFQERLPCQQSHEDDDAADEDDDSGDTSRDLIEAACDLVGATAKILGPAFLPYLDQIIQFLAEFTKATRPEDHRRAASGCVGEIAEGLGGEVRRYFVALLPYVKLGLADASSHVRRNSAWCMGVMYEALGEEATPYAMDVLQSLHPLFTPTQDDGSKELMDNAAGAVARMILTTPGSMPMQAVLPVFVQALPLKADFCENETVYKCLLKLVQSGIPDLVPHVPTLVGIYNQCFSNPQLKIGEEVMAHQVLPALQLVFQNPAYRQQALTTVPHLSVEMKNALAQQGVQFG